VGVAVIMAVPAAVRLIVKLVAVAWLVACGRLQPTPARLLVELAVILMIAANFLVFYLALILMVLELAQVVMKKVGFIPLIP